VNPTIITNWNNCFVFHINVRFVNSKGMVYRADTTTKWQLDSMDFIQKKDMIEEKTTRIYCKGERGFDIEVEFSEDGKTYRISFLSPDCPEYITYDVKNNIHAVTHDSSVREHQGIQITLPASFPGQPVGNDPNVLSGTFDEIIPAILGIDNSDFFGENFILFI